MCCWRWMTAIRALTEFTLRAPLHYCHGSEGLRMGIESVCVFMTQSQPLQAEWFHIAQGGAEQVGVEHSAGVFGEFA